MRFSLGLGLSPPSWTSSMMAPFKWLEKSVIKVIHTEGSNWKIIEVKWVNAPCHVWWWSINYWNLSDFRDHLLPHTTPSCWCLPKTSAGTALDCPEATGSRDGIRKCGKVHHLCTFPTTSHHSPWTHISISVFMCNINIFMYISIYIYIYIYIYTYIHIYEVHICRSYNYFYWKN